MKRALVIIPSILVVLLAIAVIAPGFMDWNQYKPQAQQQVKNLTGLDLDLAGDIGFTILPSPRIMAENVTIKAPAGSKLQTLASLERLDVNVDLFPLLSGQVSVKYVTLVKPEINLEMLADGKLNAMTPEIEALKGNGTQEAGKKASGPDISLEKIVIDNGVFSYYDHATKTDTTIRNINADIVAKTLQGPYRATGSLFYEGQAAEFDVQADKIDTKTGQMQPKIKLTLRPADLELSYVGTLNTAGEIGGQGVLTANAPSISKVMEQLKLGALSGKDTPLKMKGVLTADATKIDYRDFEMTLDDDPLTGSFGMLFEPLKYALEIKAPNGIEVAKLTPQLPMFKRATFNIKLEGDAQTTKIHSSAVKLDKQEFNLSGSYAVPKKSGRAVAFIDFSTGYLDYDALAAKIPAQKNSGGDIESSLRSAALPLDLDLGINAGKLKYQGQTLEKVGAKLKFRDNALSFSGVSLKNFAGSDITASGEIKDISNASGITLDLAVDARDIRALAKALSVDASGIPEQVKSANVKARLTGSAKSMDMTTNIAAINGEFVAQGKIGQPMKGATLEDLALQIKHKNMAELLQKVTGAESQDANFAKPMDVYAKITQNGKTYNLSGLKGDLAGFTVQGDAKIDTSAAKPYLSGNLKFGKITLVSSVTTGKAATKGGAGGGERWSKEPINAQALNAMDADIALSASSITYGPWPLIAPEMKIALKDGVLNVTDMKAGLFEGSLAMKATVQSIDKPRQPVHIQSNAALNDVSVSHLIRALAGSQMIDASGKVSGNLDITTSGISPAALVFDLGGQGVITGSDIVLNGVDVTRFASALSDESKPGDSLLGIWKGTTKGGRTQFDTLDGNYVIKEGIITIQKLDLDGPEANIATIGTISLPQWTLSTKHKITVKPQGDVPADVPPFEMAFSGPLDNPAQTFGQGVLQDYLNRKVSKKFEKLLGDKLGLPKQEDNSQPQEVLPSSGEEQKNTRPPKETTPEDLIKQILQPQSEQPAQQPEQPPEQQTQEQPKKEEKKDPDPEDVVKDVLKGLLR